MTVGIIRIEGPYTTTERNALTGMPTNMVILNSDYPRLEIWDGAGWQAALGDNITVDGALTVMGSVSVGTTLDVQGAVTAQSDVSLEQRTSFGGRIVAKQLTGLASANDLTLEDSGTQASGNVFEITGATQINAIATALWGLGSQVTLMFASTPTVKHNTAGGAGTAVILLKAAVDFVASAGSTLTLVYSHIGGVNAWREI